MSRFTAVFAALVSLLAAEQANANLIVNGTFESSFSSQGTLFPTGWTSNNFESGISGIMSSPGVDPDGGSSALSLSNFVSHGLATIQQDVNTVSNATYTLTYWYTSKGDSSATQPPGIELQVLWNGTIADDLIDPPHSTNGFTEHTLTLTGTGHDTLKFAGLNDPGFSFLDNVDLEGQSQSAVPEPSSFAVFGLMGALGLLVSARRRKSAVAT